ncbi:MAG: c-type cytochrome [Candidatus Acidiferrales bacterium]
MRNTREASTLEETVAKTTSLDKLLLGMGSVGVIFLLGLPARAQETPETLFKGKCGMCHGPDGAGKTMMGEKLKIPDLQSAVVQKKADTDLKAIIIKGKNKMPGYETKLSKEQVDKLVAYLRDLAKKH